MLHCGIPLGSEKPPLSVLKEEVVEGLSANKIPNAGVHARDFALPDKDLGPYQNGAQLQPSPLALLAVLALKKIRAWTIKNNTSRPEYS